MLAYIVGALGLCFLTPYGSALLLAIAAGDVVAILVVKSSIGASWEGLIRSETRRVRVMPKKQ